MNEKTGRIHWGYVIIIVLLLSGCIDQDEDKASNTEEISVRLSWLMDANQAGFVTALEKGYYAQENLDVKLRPGGLDFPSIQMVASGRDDIGITSGSETMITSSANDIPIKAFAVLYQVTPFGFMSLSESGISHPRDWAGKTIAVSYGRPLEITYRMLIKKYGIDTTNIKEVKKNPDARTLISGQVDVWPTFRTNAIVAREASKKFNKTLTTIWASEHGIDSYAYTMFTTDKMLSENPEQVEGFLRASAKGWRYALANPEEAIDFVMKHNKNLEKDIQLKVLKEARTLIPVDDAKTPIGWMEEDRWQTIQDNMLSVQVIEEPVDLSEVYTMRILEKVYPDNA